MKARVVVCLLLGGVAAVIFHRLRGFFPQHAALVGLAVAAFVYSLLRAFDNLRLASNASGDRVPRDQEKSQDQ